VKPHRSRLPWWLAALPLVAATSAVIWAAAAPIVSESRDEIFEIPKGTWARRMSGDKVDILPDEILLTLGVNDILVLKNLDDVPQIFGPTLMMPGQSFKLPFEQAASYQFACTAHTSGQMTVTVAPTPDSAGDRLTWRLRTLAAWLDKRWKAIRS